MSSDEHLKTRGQEGGISDDQDGEQKNKSLTLNKENFSTVQGSTIPFLKAYPRRLKGVKFLLTNAKYARGIHK